MGLGAPKRRNKLSHDPNNTQWSKSTTNFGHKILSQQGWKPGGYLGAENASHSDHYTAANASHIKVFLREEGLGLGAKVGGNNAETFGLSLFSGVLGRLNGKSEEEVEKHQSRLRDAELRTYSDRKYGSLGFVSGGFLVGDRIQATAEEDDILERGHSAPALASIDSSKVRKKRKSEDGSSEKNEKKKRKVEVDESQTEAKEAESSEEVEASKDEKSTSSKKKDKKSKKKSESSRKAKPADESEPTSADDDRARRKAERRARKEERRKRKEEKRKSKSESKSKSTENTETESVQPSTQTSGTSTPQRSDTIAGRNAVRQRYIQSKRMASMDPRAMKEIFMLSAAG